MHIFINSTSIERPAYFTKYYNSQGETYHRIESAIDSRSFEKDSTAIRIELYRNGSVPVMVEVVHRGG